jgi:hypothetical protein
MPSNTGFDPRNIDDFEKSKLNKDTKSKFQTADLGTTTNIDFTLSDDVLLAGGSVFLVKNAKWGDRVSFQILYGQNVIMQFITDWYLNPESIKQDIPSSNYPAKLSTGLVLRIVYTSIGIVGTDSPPEVAINYNFEKVLM